MRIGWHVCMRRTSRRTLISSSPAPRVVLRRPLHSARFSIVWIRVRASHRPASSCPRTPTSARRMILSSQFTAFGTPVALTTISGPSSGVVENALSSLGMVKRPAVSRDRSSRRRCGEVDDRSCRRARRTARLQPLELLDLSAVSETFGFGRCRCDPASRLARHADGALALQRFGGPSSLRSHTTRQTLNW